MTDSSESGGGTKRCSECREVKPLAEFHRRAKSPDGRQGVCRPCAIARNKKYREDNREACNAARRDWWKRNPDRGREYHRRFNEKNPGYAARKTQEWREKNPEKLAEQRARHPDYYREWRAKNPDKVIEWVHVRRARIANAPEIRPVKRLEIAERDGWKCHICGKRVTKKDWSLDHLVPLSKGGSHTPENVALAHRRCNSRRGTGCLPAQLRLVG